MNSLNMIRRLFIVISIYAMISFVLAGAGLMRNIITTIGINLGIFLVIFGLLGYTYGFSNKR